MAEKMKTLVALILDKSGSMQHITQYAINNFNEQLQTLKEQSNSPEIKAKKVLLAADPNDVEDGIETKVSIVLFNHSIDTILFDANIDNVSEITENEYMPSGNTALFDAIGATIDKFLGHYDLTDPNIGVLFVIITDGQENSSKNYSGKEGSKRLKSVIEELKATGKWTFTFLGTSDALDQAEEIGINNRMAFEASDIGLKTMSVAQNEATAHYYSARRMNKSTSVEDFYSSK